MLTYPGAEALVEAIHEELRAVYPAVPPCITFGDESSGDFGIAHFLGASPDSPSVCRITFDDNHAPIRYVVCHEIGHALSWNVQQKTGSDGFDGFYQQFWTARNFPGTPWEAQLRAIERERMATNSGYRYWPEENLADAFGAVNSYGQGTLITETYGAYLDEPKLRAFYKSLEGAFDLTDEDIDKIARAVANRILPEVMTKLDSGFNTSVTTFLNRLAAGDKKVETAAIDQ